MANDDVRALYDDRPYPPEGQAPRSNAVSSAWLRGAVHPANAPLRDGARVLVAGCGTGAEAEQFAAVVPKGEVVGIDNSAVSIGKARALSGHARYEQVDLEDAARVASLGPFDFISCHAVADYVPDSLAMLRGFADALTDSGVLLLAVNTPHHPKQRVQRLFEALGEPGAFEDSEAQRSLLELAGAWMGPVPGVGDLGSLPAHVAAADLFPPFAHHRAPSEWIDLARAAGLHAVGLRRGAEAVLAAGEQVSALFGLGRVELGRLAHEVAPAASAWMLFSRQELREPRFSEDLGTWTPFADPSVPRDQIPPLTGEESAPRSLTVAMNGVGVQIPVTALGLEILRRSDGTLTLSELCDDWTAARADLFRLFHADLLHFSRVD
ncbi:MAG: class I SAM-dependent methyltransferase [Proteobacteria bacterium]|nr:class I SAM-dependent methyltransferase [Pseudomonadota bacterium]